MKENEAYKFIMLCDGVARNYSLVLKEVFVLAIDIKLECLTRLAGI
jgi:hypothetical protein